MMVANHFFHSLREWILEMEDPRNQSYTTLVRGKQFNKWHLQGKYWKVILDEGFEWIKSGEDAVRQTGLCKEKGTGFFANHVEEVAGKEETMNVFEYEYESKDKEGDKRTVCFQQVTNLELTKRNLEEMILAGRGRWKIENEGFNNCKKNKMSDSGKEDNKVYSSPLYK